MFSVFMSPRRPGLLMLIFDKSDKDNIIKEINTGRPTYYHMKNPPFSTCERPNGPGFPNVLAIEDYAQ
jgi:hypothetical protein